MENQTQKITQTLRLTGILAIVASSVVFLVQGLNALSSFERYWSFAGMTALLAGLGLFASSKLKEAKGARTFLSLAAAATPVLFAQLGAMVHSLVVGTASTNLPQAFIVTAPSLAAIAAALGGTVALLLPILFIGFRTFFRDRASTFVGTLLLLSSFLLIPFRDANLISILILVETLSFTWVTLKSKVQNDSRLETAVAALLPLLPVAILIGRQTYYSTSYFFAASVFVLISALFGQILPHFAPKKDDVLQFRTLGLFTFGISWSLFSAGIFEFISVPNSVEWLVITYPVVIGFLMSNVMKDPHQSQPLRRFLEFLTVAVPVGSVLMSWDPTTALVQILLGSFAMSLGLSFRKQVLFGSGGILNLLGLGYFLTTSFHYFSAAPWVSLAGLGMLAIVASSLVEKNKGKLGQWRARYQSHFNN